MKRWLAKIVVFLLLGAIVNVAVAWGCAVRPYPRVLFTSKVSPWPSRYYEWTSPDGFHTYIVERSDEWGVSQLRMLALMNRIGPPPQRLNDSQYRDLVPDWSAFAKQEVWARPGADFLKEQANGWPLLCLRLYGSTIVGEGVTSRQLGMTGRLELPWFDRPWRNVVPYLPIWPGFAINTIFYAVILWLLTLGPFTARRLIRRKRGHCLKCGYDLRGAEHEVCPECGVAVVD